MQSLRNTFPPRSVNSLSRVRISFYAVQETQTIFNNRFKRIVQRKPSVRATDWQNEIFISDAKVFSDNLNRNLVKNEGNLSLDFPACSLQKESQSPLTSSIVRVTLWFLGFLGNHPNWNACQKSGGLCVREMKKGRREARGRRDEKWRQKISNFEPAIPSALWARSRAWIKISLTLSVALASTVASCWEDCTNLSLCWPFLDTPRSFLRLPSNAVTIFLIWALLLSSKIDKASTIYRTDSKYLQLYRL